MDVGGGGSGIEGTRDFGGGAVGGEGRERVGRRHQAEGRGECERHGDEFRRTERVGQRERQPFREGEGRVEQELE